MTAEARPLRTDTVSRRPRPDEHLGTTSRRSSTPKARRQSRPLTAVRRSASCDDVAADVAGCGVAIALLIDDGLNGEMLLPQEADPDEGGANSGTAPRANVMVRPGQETSTPPATSTSAERRPTSAEARPGERAAARPLRQARHRSRATSSRPTRSSARPPRRTPRTPRPTTSPASSTSAGRSRKSRWSSTPPPPRRDRRAGLPAGQVRRCSSALDRQEEALRTAAGQGRLLREQRDHPRRGRPAPDAVQEVRRGRDDPPPGEHPRDRRPDHPGAPRLGALLRRAVPRGVEPLQRLLKDRELREPRRRCSWRSGESRSSPAGSRERGLRWRPPAQLDDSQPDGLGRAWPRPRMQLGD